MINSSRKHIYHCQNSEEEQMDLYDTQEIRIFVPKADDHQLLTFHEWQGH